MSLEDFSSGDPFEIIGESLPPNIDSKTAPDYIKILKICNSDTVCDKFEDERTFRANIMEALVNYNPDCHRPWPTPLAIKNLKLANL